MQEKIKDIIIDLPNSGNARLFSDTLLIHQRELEIVTGWIDDLRSKQTAKDDQRMHEAISVFGTRGSGKSTFLLNVLNRYDRPDSPFCVLGIIDPTVIEEKGHIFVDILSRVKELVDDALDAAEADARVQYLNRKRDWQEAIRKLAAGIPLIDGVGGEMTANNWQDAEYILDNGLSAVLAARQLESNFHKLIRLALDILQKEVFLITFDDIDIDFRKGWLVLETIRKYFTTSKIVTMISGDQSLYSKAIRKQQWKNLGKPLLLNEKNDEEQLFFNSMVTEMEGQYLQKIMKLERRITLLPLNEKIPFYEGEYSLSIKNSEGKREPIKTFYDAIFHKFGIFNPSQTGIYRDFLLGLPMRTQIQFMRAMDASDWSQHITDAFLHYLFENSVDVQLAQTSNKFLNPIILKLLLSAEILEEGYQLQPTLQRHSLNASLTALSFLSAKKTETDPMLIFDYFIKIGYLRNLEAALYFSGSGSGPSVNGLASHAGLLQDKVLRDSAGLMNAYVRGVLNTERYNEYPWGGTIVLYTLGEVAKQSQAVIADRIDIVFQDHTRCLAYIPLAICQSGSRQAGLLTYSVYALLATIGELIRKGGDIEQGFYDFSQLRSYAMPDFQSGPKSSADVIAEDQTNSPAPGELPLRFGRLMKNWADRFPKMAFSPHLLGKISTRFFYALLNIEQRLDSEGLGSFFQLQILGFMNAVLIEEAKESSERYYRDLKLDNVSSSPRIFLENLKTIGRYRADWFDLSKWLFSCPLLAVYLDKEIRTELSKFIDENFGPEIADYNIFERLNQVSYRKRTVARVKQDVSGDFEKIVSQLQKDRIPFEYFDQNSKNSAQSNNRFIKTLKGYFGEGPVSTTQIRNFRKLISRRS